MSVEFWLSYNNNEEKLRLPVNPSTVSVSSSFGNTDLEVSHFGEITVIGERGATNLSFDSFFPSKFNPTYCEYAEFPKPSECLEMIERWRDKRKPIRFIVTGTNINYAATIRDFNYDVERAGSPGDIYYSLSLKEYRFLDTKAKVQNVNKPKPQPAKQRPPVINKPKPKMKTYTVKSGDSLWKIFGKDWKEAYELNKKVIGNNPNLIYPGQKFVIHQ